MQFDTLRERLASRDARVGVVGLGYVGLPLAVAFARANGGFDMTAEPLASASIAAADCVAILTEHRNVDYDMVLKSARLVVDTRNAIAGKHAHVLKLGAPAPVMNIDMPGAREKAVV